jgi:hypothetical protein
MNKIAVLLIALILISPFAFAGEISETDMGTYVLLGRDRAPTDMFYRLSKSGEKWAMEGKKPGGSWKNISCDKGCDYRRTTDSEIETYFPADWRANTDIACIQNIAQSFCRFNEKRAPAKAGYVVIALVSGRPIPMFIRRVNAQ